MNRPTKPDCTNDVPALGNHEFYSTMPLLEKEKNCIWRRFGHLCDEKQGCIRLGQGISN